VSAGDYLSQSAKDPVGIGPRWVRELPGCHVLQFGTIDLFSAAELLDLSGAGQGLAHRYD
jgi:hypothetical protein